jgi:hypothetical protein
MVLYFKPRNVSAGFFLLRVNTSPGCRGFDYRSHASAPQSLSAGEDQRHQALRWSWLDRKLLTG